MFDFCTRRIGFEMEYNSFDKLSKSVDFNNLPNGIYYFGQKISDCLNKNVEVCKWQATNNNKFWVIKPDASCGLEVCSPPDNHKTLFPQLYKVIETFSKDIYIQSDLRCGFHIHFEIADFEESHILNLVENWINFEHFFFFLTSENRWLNRYCKPLGFYYGFDHKKVLTAKRCLDILGNNKYFAINFYHYLSGKRKTVEFRILSNEVCKDPDEAINWSKLFLCFIERCKSFQRDSDVVTNFSYRDIDEIYEFLDLDNYFNTDEIKQWIISKLNFLIKKENNACKVWQKILQSSVPAIERLFYKFDGEKKCYE